MQYGEIEKITRNKFCSIKCKMLHIYIYIYNMINIIERPLVWKEPLYAIVAYHYQRCEFESRLIATTVQMN